MEPLTFALPKGRLQEEVLTLLAEAGYATDADVGRKLVFGDSSGTLRFIMAKPADVPTYVEYGAAALGVVGLDVLREGRWRHWLGLTICFNLQFLCSYNLGLFMVLTLALLVVASVMLAVAGAVLINATGRRLGSIASSLAAAVPPAPGVAADELDQAETAARRLTGFDRTTAEAAIEAMRQALSAMKHPRFALNPQSDAADARLDRKSVV